MPNTHRDAHAGGPHNIASHSDTTATGSELETLTDGSETNLHSHAGGGGGADVKSGTVSILENGTVDITFATAFSTTPVVVANVQDSGEYNVIQITAVSTTGATLALEKVGGGSSSTYLVGWMATDAGNA